MKQNHEDQKSGTGDTSPVPLFHTLERIHHIDVFYLAGEHEIDRYRYQKRPADRPDVGGKIKDREHIESVGHRRTDDIEHSPTGIQPHTDPDDGEPYILLLQYIPDA